MKTFFFASAAVLFLSSSMVMASTGAEKLFEALRANPNLGNCAITKVALNKTHLHLTLEDQGTYHQFKMSRDDIREKNPSTINSHFVQEWMTGSEAMPLVLESRVKLKASFSGEGHLQKLSIKKVDFGLFPVIPAGVENIVCED